MFRGMKYQEASFERISVASARTSGMVDQECGLKLEPNWDSVLNVPSSESNYDIYTSTISRRSNS